jgi:hypothetical protein
MKHVDSESPFDVAHWLRSESASLWAAVLGSLSAAAQSVHPRELLGVPVLASSIKIMSHMVGEPAS